MRSANSAFVNGRELAALAGEHEGARREQRGSTREQWGSSEGAVREQLGRSLPEFGYSCPVLFRYGFSKAAA